MITPADLTNRKVVSVVRFRFSHDHNQQVLFKKVSSAPHRAGPNSATSRSPFFRVLDRSPASLDADPFTFKRESYQMVPATGIEPARP